MVFSFYIVVKIWHSSVRLVLRRKTNRLMSECRSFWEFLNFVLKKVHLIVLWVRKTILYFVSKRFIVSFRWRKRETSFPVKQGTFFLSNVNFFIFLMLSNHLPEDTGNRPHLNSRVVLVLHQNDLWSSVPSTHDMTGHKLRLWLTIS